MFKCNPKKSNFKEYKKFCLNSLEPGVPQFCENYIFHKLVCGKEIVCIIGHQYSNEPKTYLVGSFSKNSSKYIRDLIEWGKIYLDFISKGPIEIIVETGQKTFERFATYFGFEKTLAQIDINGIMCTVYTRASKCLPHQLYL